MRKKEVCLKGVVTLQDAATHLENLAACIRRGTVCVQNCDDHVTLAPAEHVKLEVSATQRDAKEVLELKLAWHKASPEAEAFNLKITSEEPPEPEPVKDAPEAPAAKTDTASLAELR